MKPFAEQVVAEVAAKGPLCAGVDPSTELLEAWGLPDSPSGLARFAEVCLEAFTGTVAIIKPQVAFFERFGSAGLGVLEDLLTGARSAGLLTIADAKRADIASTVAAYAEAWLDPRRPLAADAVTAVAYLGLGSLEPFLEAAEAQGRGVFVVCRSSNPDGAVVQEARGPDGLSVADQLLVALARRNEAFCRAHPGCSLGPFGVVFGATNARAGEVLSSLGGLVLAPGLGAQGAKAADAGRLFGACPPNRVLGHVSRSLLRAGPDPASLAARARELADELAAALR